MNFAYFLLNRKLLIYGQTFHQGHREAAIKTNSNDTSKDSNKKN